MSDLNQIQDTLNLEEHDMKELPSTLNILTILTYIGSGIGLLGSVYNYFTICKSADKLTSGEMPEVGGTLGKIVDAAIELSIKQCDNRLVIFVTSFVTCLICLFGAALMRGLKKQGFMVYLIGEIIAPMSMIVILGNSAFGGMMLVLGLIVPIVMVILYSTQRRYLIN